MIIPFHIAGNAFDDIASMNHSDSKECRHLVEICMESFYQFWDRHGVMVVFSGDDQGIDLIDPGRILRNSVRFGGARWFEEMKRNRVYYAEITGHIAKNYDLNNLEAFSKFVKAIAVPFHNRSGIPEVGRAYDFSGNKIYVSSIYGVHHCINKEFEYIAHPSIEKGDTAEDIWAKFFHDISTYSKNISIVDGYCGARLLQQLSGNRIAGIEFFLRKINDVAKYRSDSNCSFAINIYAAHGVKYTNGTKATLDEIAQVFETIRDGLSHIYKVNLFLLHQDEFKKIFHDRYIRYNRTSIEIGSGLEVMDNGKAWRDSAISINIDSKAHRRNETQITNLCLQKKNGIRIKLK